MGHFEMQNSYVGQMTFGWAADSQDNVAVASVVAETKTPVADSRVAEKPTRISRAPIAVTAKPMDQLLEQRSSKSAVSRRNGTDHISDLLLIVLEKYGIDADEFLSGLNQ